MDSEKDDPRSGLLEVHGQTAEYWSSDGAVRTAFEFAKGLVSKGDEPDMGDNDTIAL